MGPLVTPTELLASIATRGRLRVALPSCHSIYHLRHPSQWKWAFSMPPAAATKLPWRLVFLVPIPVRHAPSL
jgi:hypothetical protein